MIERLPQHSAAAFMTSRSAADIANQLRIDDALNKQGQACSWIALYAPTSGTREAIEIAQCLTPSSDFSTNIKRVLYENTISRLRRSLNGKGIFATQHEIDKATKELQAARMPSELSFERLHTALEVLEYLQDSDVFALVKNTRRCLREWGGVERLHLLVNNAAQTLTDSVRKEERAIEREITLLDMAGDSGVCVQGSYKARVRGGGLLMALSGMDKERGLIENGSLGGLSPASSPLGMTKNGTSLELQSHDKSSWVQSLFEIPYEDVISAHSVNTFVPLILCRELLPLMGQGSTQPEESDVQHDQPGGSQSGGTKPEGYIVNVSSREGIFEDRTRSIGKAGKHVHTNMSKAALNMITETEAASAWQERRIAMNTIDPGYMSAAPEYEGAFDGQRPIGWEDGAGRVLWPVAVGELKGEAIWGRFLKHYGAVEVNPSAGRG
ncbi:hypothetical protein N0V86_005071 [Didymella sp. IMI 355093]|nr:hypothetical protein N0V86_005071 [Didymella sp. IMI 355093]